MTYEHDQYYKAELIGVRYVALGEKATPAVQFVVRMENGEQDAINKFVSGGAKQYTEQCLIDLGCDPSDLTGADWLKKINTRIGGMAVVTRAKAEQGYATKLNGIYKPKIAGTEITSADSPFGAPMRSTDDFGTIPGGDDLPF